VTPNDLTRDRLEGVLQALPRQGPRPEAADRLRSKCRERMARQRHSHGVLMPALRSRGGLLAKTAFAGALGLIYLAAVVGRAFSLYGF
jgi:hypothetical protein